MKLAVKNQRLFEKLTLYFATFARVLLNVLLIIIFVALTAAIIKCGYDLLHSLHKTLEAILQSVLLDVVFIIALAEITMVILGYLKDGSVHVRYIVDTILIIMLNEFVSLWFNHPKLPEIAALCLSVLTLTAVRLGVILFAPKRDTTS